MYHNHEDKDYSHPWYTPERLNRPDEGMARMMHSHSWMRILFPYYGWHLYLYGMPDGSHYFPFMSQRLWADSTPEERRKCYLSVAVVGVFLAAYLYFFGSFAKFAYYYLGPYVVFGWWLVTVTYLQHHDHKTLVYTDEDWNFVTAAFETVDRTFGYGIDEIHHHITDGHVAHHLFFTKIPHYNLPMATKAIRAYLEENNLGYMYKHDECRDFFIRVHQYFVDFGFKAKRASSKKAD
jgi:omega-3 fatty acid desaturase (delta-15 desaturase)